MRNNKWKDIWGSEWDYVERLGRAIIDPEEKKTFWENIKRLKEEDPAFSIYSLFPASESATRRAMNDCLESVRRLYSQPKKEERVEEKRTEEEEIMGELVELGAHRFELCLWPRRMG
jgi:hypothetical protein